MNDDLRPRLEALERSLGRWRATTVGLVSVVLLGTLVAAIRPEPEVIQCKRLEVLGSGRRPAVRLGISAEGDGLLEIMDGGGRELLRLPLDRTAPATLEETRQRGIVETSIRGTFSGFSRGRMFEFVNGQVWQQTSSETSIAVRLGPKVTLYRSKDGWTLHVQGELHPVLVRPVR